MRQFIASITLFEVVVCGTLFCWIWAVLHRFPADALAIIGGTVGLGVWGRVKGQAS